MDMTKALAEVNAEFVPARVNDVTDEEVMKVAKIMASRGYRHNEQTLGILRECLKQRAHGRGIVIKGPVGTGKSFFFYVLGIPALNMQLAQAQNIQDLKRALDSYANTPILIDDLGAERSGYKSFGSNIDLANFVFECRTDCTAPTYFTCNLTPEELHKRYGDRTVDRLTGLAEWCELTGESKRNASMPPSQEAWFNSFFKGRLWRNCSRLCSFYDSDEHRCTKGKTEEPRAFGDRINCPYWS